MVRPVGQGVLLVACQSSKVEVLKDEIAVRGSPRALTVLPAFGTKALKPVPAGTDSKKYVADKKAVKKTLSWAEVARK